MNLKEWESIVKLFRWQVSKRQIPFLEVNLIFELINIKMKRKLPELKTCLILDAIGCVSYIFPPFGPVWAFISGIIFYFMFGKRLGLFGGAFSFIEELLPGLDILPTFTIAWFMRKREIEKENSMKPLRVMQ